jgi:hypothetical protein
MTREQLQKALLSAADMLDEMIDDRLKDGVESASCSNCGSFLQSVRCDKCPSCGVDIQEESPMFCKETKH